MSDGAVLEDLIYDVGLHEGEDAAFYMAMGYRVVGFEANPDLAAGCRARFAAELGSGQFSLVEGAIDASLDETVTFYRHSTDSVWGTTDEAWVRRNRALGGSIPLQVPAVNFMACLDDTGIPYYMKVDIEGADGLCFDALGAFSHRPVYVSLESTKTDFNALIAEFDALEDLGYNRFAVVQQCGIENRELTATGRDGRTVSYRFESGSSGPFGLDVGPWMTRDQALTRYRKIFRQYRRFGDGSLVQRSRATRKLRDRWAMLRGTTLPGWYDTHATRG